MKVSEVDERFWKLGARHVRGKEIPAVYLSSAHVVADELFLHTASSYEVGRSVDHDQTGQTKQTKQDRQIASTH
jgi:hypothetical protein